jgi:hypothetical protein
MKNERQGFVHFKIEKKSWTMKEVLFQPTRSSFFLIRTKKISSPKEELFYDVVF